MCEIAVVPNTAPDHADNIVGVAKRLYQQNNHGLGIVAVYPNSGSFHYETYAKQNPDFDSGVASFVLRNSNAWRLIIHARLATAGGRGDEQTHPLDVSECGECDLQHVVHNGVVRNHHHAQRQHRTAGHNYNTEVDSEAIAHEIGGVPDSLDDLEYPSLQGRLNYLVMAEDGILLRMTEKYSMRDDFRIACNAQPWDLKSNGYESRCGYMIVRPDQTTEYQDEEDLFESVTSTSKWYGKSVTSTVSGGLMGNGSQSKTSTRTKSKSAASSSGGTNSGSRGSASGASSGTATAASTTTTPSKSDPSIDPDFWHAAEDANVRYCSRHYTFFGPGHDGEDVCRMCDRYGEHRITEQR